MVVSRLVGFAWVTVAGCVAACGSSASTGSPTAGEESVVAAATFTNPVLAEDCPDPGVMQVEEDSAPAFYMVCTGGRMEIRRSTDLVTWRRTSAFLLPESGQAPWANNGFRNWAPEIHEVARGSFVAYYTASDADDHLAIGVAHASSPLGPWVHEREPLVRHPIGVIDATYFADPGGQSYLYWKVDGNQRGERTPILARELAANGTAFRMGSTEEEVLTNDPGSWEGGLVEAPWIVKHDDAYFLFYSANVFDERYVTGVAKGTSPLGPFVKAPEPILVNNETWLGPGHGSVVQVGSVDWFVHHAWRADGNGDPIEEEGRHVLLDPIVWQDGWPHFAFDASATGRQPRPLSLQ